MQLGLRFETLDGVGMRVGRWSGAGARAVCCFDAVEKVLLHSGALVGSRGMIWSCGVSLNWTAGCTRCRVGRLA